MPSLVIVVSLAQAVASCDAGLAAARTAYAQFDAATAGTVLQAALARGCRVEDALTYVRALIAARAASAAGGAEESLAPVRRAADALAARNDRGGPIEIASLVLRAAAAASQSERGEMSVYLAQSLQIERARSAEGKPTAPVATAHEVAAELWLQVHRYEEAATAFVLARATSGDTLRTTLGLARALARQKKTADACAEYRRFAAGARRLAPALAEERGEAARFVGQAVCRTAPPSAR